MKDLHETKTDGIDLTDGLKIDDFEKLELNILNKNICEPSADKTSTQLYVSKEMNKKKGNHEYNQEENLEGILEEDQIDSFEENIEKTILISSNLCVRSIFKYARSQLI